MTDMSWISKEIGEELGYALSEVQSAYIGNPITKEPRFNGEQKGTYWIHGVQPDPDAPFTAVNALPFAAKYLEYDAPVLVRKFVNGYVIVDLNPDEIWDFFGDESRYDNTQVPVTVDQFAFGTIQPDAPTLSMKVLLKGATYFLDGIAYHVSDIRTSAISGSVDVNSADIDIPTSIQLARGVMIQINPITGLYSFKQSSYLAVLPLPRAFQLGDLELPDEGNFLMGYVRLLAGMTVITRDHIWNSPELLAKNTPSGSVSDIITSEGLIVVTSDGQVVTKGAIY